jgi:hypothetical protein
MMWMRMMMMMRLGFLMGIGKTVESISTPAIKYAAVVMSCSEWAGVASGPSLLKHLTCWRLDRRTELHKWGKGRRPLGAHLLQMPSRFKAPTRLLSF